jgi:hypothetical protein
MPEHVWPSSPQTLTHVLIRQAERYGDKVAFAYSRKAAVVNVGSVSPLTFPWLEALEYAALAAAAAILAAIVPAWKSTKAASSTALQDE